MIWVVDIEPKRFCSTKMGYAIEPASIGFHAEIYYGAICEPVRYWHLTKDGARRNILERVGFDVLCGRKRVELGGKL